MTISRTRIEDRNVSQEQTERTETSAVSLFSPLSPVNSSVRQKNQGQKNDSQEKRETTKDTNHTKGSDTKDRVSHRWTQMHTDNRQTSADDPSVIFLPQIFLPLFVCFVSFVVPLPPSVIFSVLNFSVSRSVSFASLRLCVRSVRHLVNFHFAIFNLRSLVFSGLAAHRSLPTSCAS